MKIYVITSVRNATEEQKEFADNYVAGLEELGHEVHYPPRDVNQDDESGINICEAHRAAMIECDIVDVIWDPSSTGSHFDLGMAYVLQELKGIQIRCVNKLQRTPHKSYTNFLLELEKRRGVFHE
jgi:nucleoside 2-deoxyribosyltransferase